VFGAGFVRRQGLVERGEAVISGHEKRRERGDRSQRGR
jgi:hypothetical protein